jgi:hypothetical protein
MAVRRVGVAEQGFFRLGLSELPTKSLFSASLIIQISSQYGVAHEKLLLTYQAYAASQFFVRALSCLEL